MPSGKKPTPHPRKLPVQKIFSYYSITYFVKIYTEIKNLDK
jgi:hypothetical protein